jgi:hypothetical protein
MGTKPGRLAAIVLTLLAAGACEGVIDPSENRIETFDGTLTQFGRSLHDFNVERNGEVEVKFTALSNPDALLEISYGLGNCNNPAVLNFGYRRLTDPAGVGGLVSRGPHCAWVTDSLGILTQPATYTLRVSHP